MAIEKRRLGDIAHLYIGIPTRIADTQKVGRSGNVLTVRSLTGTDIDTSELEVVDFDSRDIEKYRVATGDVLLSSRSTSLKTAIVSKELDGTIINATLLGVRTTPHLHPRLLVAWLNHPEGRAALESIAQSGTAQMNITVAGLSRLEVPVPPMHEQKQLVKLLEATDEAYATAIEAAEERRRLAQQIVISQLKNVGNL